MPHDVIMPALGMAQDTGKLLSWAKQPGDAVAAGDVLFEVETDKATMEVEAQADGFLGQVRASAGDDVPVGDVVAVISETADDAEPARDDAKPAPAPDAADNGSLPDGAQVIMPALGMAQDTGLIVSWQKAPGDAVSADDVLLEVETDKSVMEVPAGHEGYVAAILADAQEAVPVGAVIAIISARKPENAIQRSAASAPASSPKQAPADKEPEQQAPAKPEPTAGKPKPATAAVAPGGRILASPKARRLAAQQGLDLERLVAHGVEQPFHVADLETLRSLGSQASSDSQGQPTGSPQPAVQSVEAVIEADGTAALIDWMKEEGASAPSERAVFARFASAALRAVQPDIDAPLVIAVTAPRASHAFYADADRVRLTADLMSADEAGEPALIVRDFTSSAISTATADTNTCPVLSVARDTGRLRATLHYRDHQLTQADALDLVDAFANAVADPLCNLL